MSQQSDHMSSLVKDEEGKGGQVDGESVVLPASSTEAVKTDIGGPVAGGGDSSVVTESASASAVAACDAEGSVEGADVPGAASKTIFGKKSDKNRVLSDADRQMSPLQIAFSRGHDEIVRLLISRGALG